METLNFSVRLTPEQAELILADKLCGKFGATLSDKREVELCGQKSTVLVFSKFYKRCVSLFGLTVVLSDKEVYCDVSIRASNGQKGAPIVGNMGADLDFCREARIVLAPYIL